MSDLVVDLPSAGVGAVVDDANQIRGTAFWVSPTTAVSCKHVIDYCGDGPIRLFPVAADDSVAVTKVDVDEGRDLAVLTTDTAPAGVHPLPLVVGRDVGEVVVSHGYPNDVLSSVYPKGVPMDVTQISGITTVRRNDVDNVVLVLDGAAPAPGQSGGPAFSASSRSVIGVLRFRSKAAADSGSPRTYAVPTSDLVKRWPELAAYVVETIDSDPTAMVAPSEIIAPVGLPPRRRLIRSDSAERLAGRADELACIEEALQTHSSAAVVTEADPESPETPTEQPTTGFDVGAVTLHGWAGVGKSALAVEYCYQNLGSYSAVWFVNAATDLTIMAAYSQLATKLKIPTQGLEDHVVRELVEDHLAQRVGWLAVFDNAVDRASVERWLPNHDNGHLLVTSRNPARWDHRILIDKLSLEDTRDWLLNATSTLPPTSDDLDVATKLAAELDGLPLAVAQAVAFIQDNETPLETYLELFRSEQADLLQSGEPLGYPHNVATTITLATKALNEAGHEHAVRLLALIAYVFPDRIPVELFTPQLLGAAKNIELENAVGALSRYGLISRGGNELWVHRLTQAVARDNPPPLWPTS